jgi:pyruvate dehydrogenase E1 component alpha subunit
MAVASIDVEGLTRIQSLHFLEQMYVIRAFEEKADELFALGRVHGTMHLSIGQEAVAVGAGNAIRPDDYLVNHHRGHGHCIVKGADINLMMAEFMGKATGLCRGRGGSMHIADVARGNLGANGIVAGGIPLAVGAGLGIQMQQQGKIVLSLFGDGAMNEGAFNESLNLAAVWKLPIVFLCENNQYAMSMPVAKAFAVPHLSERALGYGIPAETLDGNDVYAVYDAVSEAAERARRGEGPTLLECVTYRWKGHSKSDPQKYRTRAEVEQWKKHDPIKHLETHLRETGQLTAAELEKIQAGARETIEAALKFADASPEPDVGTILEDVYS